MSRENAAKGGGGEKGGGGKARITLLIVFLIALIGGGYLTYRDLVTPFSPLQVTVVGPDADVSVVPRPGSGETPAQVPATPTVTDDAAAKPEDQATAPRGEEASPSTGTGEPDGAATGAEEQPTAPETDEPTTVTTAAEPAATEPEAAATEPEAAAIEPEAAAIEPEAAAIEPEAAATEPEEPATEPAAAAAEPEAAATEPEEPGTPEEPVSRPAETASVSPPAAPGGSAPEDAADTTKDASVDEGAGTPAPAGPPPEASATQDIAAAPRADQDTLRDALPAPGTESAATTRLPEDASAPDLSLEAVETPRPEADADAVTQPTFDIIRIDNTGGGLVAGRAAPGTTVNILSGDSVIGTAEASEGGEFVAFIQTPSADEGQVLSLAASEGVAGAAGGENVLVLPSPDDGDEPTVVKATEDEVRIVQPSPLGRVDGVTLDSISYDQTGAVALAGRAPRAQMIRIYVDGDAVAVTRSSESGTWDARLDTVDAGRYVLRVDALAEDGSVESRAESPFQRVYPTAEQISGPTRITVQPGNTLWVMAREKYGSGLLYTQIFAANREAIRDPDLIYPGQIFTLPAEDEVQR